MHATLKTATLSAIVLVASSLLGCNRAGEGDAAGSASQASQDGCSADGTCCGDLADAASCPPPPDCTAGDDGCPPEPCVDCAPVPCDPSDTTCPPAPCVDCAPDPCEAGDADCPPEPCVDGVDCPPPPPSCAADEAKGTGACDLVIGYAWQGCACVAVTGCACEGPGCADLTPSPEACELAHADCDCAPPGGFDCNAAAAELAALLEQARGCNPASMMPVVQCDVLVPTIASCAVPANGTSPVLGSYLELFAKYATSCPMPALPCPDPTPLPTSCEAVTGDGTVGQCVFADGSVWPAP